MEFLGWFCQWFLQQALSVLNLLSIITGKHKKCCKLAVKVQTKVLLAHYFSFSGNPMAAAATWVQKNFMDFCHNYFWWCWASFIVHGCKKQNLVDMTGKLSVKSWLPHPIQTTGICGCLCGECHSAVKAFANMSSRFDQLQWNWIELERPGFGHKQSRKWVF